MTRLSRALGRTATHHPGSLRPLAAAAVSACLGAGLGAVPATAHTVRMAIVAGHNRGEVQDVPLKFAESDADRFASLLGQIGGLEESNLFLLKSPTPELLRYAFTELTKKAKALQGKDEVVFFFYYSGHGDKSKIKLGNQGFALEELRGLIDSLPAQIRIGVFDACQSGSITHLKGGRTIKPLVLEQETNGKGTILITSSSEDENAQESENLQGSFFTHHWLSGLRGPADLSGDKHVSLMEAYQYAFQKTVVNTEGTTGGIQHPNARFQVDVEGDIVITDLASGDGGIRFPPEVEGKFLVVDGNSVIMAEFQKEPKREIFLALGPGTYTVFKKDGNSLRHAETVIAQGQITVFDEKGLKRGTLYASYNKGGEGKPEIIRVNAARIRPFQLYATGMEDHGFSGRFGFNYAFFGPFAVDLQATVLNLTSQQWDEEFSVGPGLEIYSFATPNLQFMLRGGYNHGFRHGMGPGTIIVRASPCFDGSNVEIPSSDPRCLVPEQHWDDNKRIHRDVWEATAGMRYWIQPMVSLQATIGFEYGDPVGYTRANARNLPLVMGLGYHF
jgi:hypothetical protein